MIVYKELELNNLDNTECLIIPVFKEKNLGLEKSIKILDKKLDDSISFNINLDDYKFKSGELKLINIKNLDNKLNIKRILLVGLGESKSLNIKTYKEVIGKAIILMQSKKLESFDIFVSSKLIKKFGVNNVVKNLVLASNLAAYSYDEHKDKEDRVKEIKKINLVSDCDKKDFKLFSKFIIEGEKLSDAVNFTRTLGNVPPTIMTPAYLVKEAKKLDKDFDKLETTIFNEAEIKKLNMGCFLGVARGSKLKPAFIIMKYNGGKKDEKPTVLVGKGITFDSGGLSLKPNGGVNMKFDMLGAATVFGVMKAAAALGLKRNIIGVTPACENMPGGDAYRPDDILVAMNGKSVHIDNTDAEGRLILADALSYVHKFDPKEVIDFATLTGACVVALGDQRSGLFSPVDKLAENLDKSAKQVGEQLWRLPVGEEYSKAMKSEISDINNTGTVGGRGCGGASTAAAFLQFFTVDYTDEDKKAYPWAHIDLSSSHISGKGNGYMRGGANGFGVQTMINYLSK